MDVREHSDSHWNRATLSKLALLGGLAAVWIAAGVVLWPTEVPTLDLPELDEGEFFTESALERSADYRALTRPLWLARTVVELVVLGFLIWQSGRIVRWIQGGVRGRVRTGMVFVLPVIFAAWLAVLPLAAVSHWWRRRFDLSEQAYGAWLGDQALSLLVRAVIIALVVGGVIALAAWLGRRWWIAMAPIVALAGFVFILIQPLVIQPLFNRFEPLTDEVLVAQIEEAGRALDVEVTSVEVADASRRTTTANALVAGIGPTAKVVLFDTLLDGRFTSAEIVWISAHELAHQARDHLWKGGAWFALLAIPAVYILYRITERFGGAQNPGLVPLGLLVVLLFFLVTLPFQQFLSRRYEAEADWLALRATGDPTAAVSTAQRFSTTALGDPTPPGWVRFWLRTHPTTMERIAMAIVFGERAAATEADDSAVEAP